MVPITEKYLHSVKEQGRRDKIVLGISYEGPQRRNNLILP